MEWQQLAKQVEACWLGQAPNARRARNEPERQLWLGWGYWGYVGVWPLRALSSVGGACPMELLIIGEARLRRRQRLICLGHRLEPLRRFGVARVSVGV